MVHKQEVLGDVWQLETPLEEQASESLSLISGEALKGDRKAQNFLKKIFEEKWKYIKPKLETEGSVWYVWWMDGVHKFMGMKR
jgi:hypothetical protein